MNYSRNDEYELDKLRSLVASGQKLSDSELKKHAELEHKYSLFIEESQKELKEKAEHGPNTLGFLQRLQIIYSNRKDRLTSWCTKSFRQAVDFCSTTLSVNRVLLFVILILECCGVYVMYSINDQDLTVDCSLGIYFPLIKNIKVCLILILLLLRFSVLFRNGNIPVNSLIFCSVIFSLKLFLVSLFSVLSVQECGDSGFKNNTAKKKIGFIYYIDLVVLCVCVVFRLFPRLA